MESLGCDMKLHHIIKSGTMGPCPACIGIVHPSSSAYGQADMSIVLHLSQRHIPSGFPLDLEKCCERCKQIGPTPNSPPRLY
jgi:hypothetical protein